RPVEVVGGSGEGLEVGGAVVRGGAVPARAAAVELFLHGGMALRSLEEQVLEKVGHAFLAIALVARAHEVGDVHGGGVASRVGHGENAQAVRQAVFRDALDRLGLLQRLRRRFLRRLRYGLLGLLRRRSSLLSESGGGEEPVCHVSQSNSAARGDRNRS